MAAQGSLRKYIAARIQRVVPSDNSTSPWSSAGVSNSNWSVGQMGTYKAIRGPHYDAEATIVVPECTRNSFYILFPAKRVMKYRQIISSRHSHSY